jgi:hypothetical protein
MRELPARARGRKDRRMTSIISPSPATQLPPWITPTLPEAAPAPTDMVETPSGLLVPKAPGTATGPSGLIIVRNELSQVSAGAKLVVPSKPIEGDGALDAAKQAYAELAAKDGEAAASIMLGGQVEMATQVRNDEIRAQAVKAFLAGDAATAGTLLGQLH